ncbi:GlxA family transcriptional regulator [Marinobacterium sp. xm-d-509]|uniref:GlxA family transcriptional regulator n=1 Tax=unclassified Marinobacterium TaxID=2644139 RepID=UPI0019E7365A|nr:HTH-type transcriptional regulator CdhR [Marinobacterium sp. xm-g-48]NRP16648.1 HTH-type transcriptional regulator CdhR [Marinobacterium sp. xm-a-152]NRP28577.1 HTH-type transcriptional regulator CdhR [Marinobacterium sp. xm-d-420]NRP38744.1 HTH-type transcriptional regulator CdhR [Marinobacterium sp. xm-a-121]NRP52261.1 HTH-type transcriptional regulator CdhR [Marinobacterium sp. xm-v-242]NRP58291.1 HTH-type transcriptional regulator CdhR [Marinobacterium sp. xm-d-510]NRP60440.1 HTH-type 
MQQKPEHFGFFLMPGFSIISFAATIDPLRLANQLSGQTLYEWHFYGPADQTVTCSTGMRFQPTRRMNDTESIDRMLVVGGIGAQQESETYLNDWLQNLVRNGISLGATSTGSLLLAEAGVLEGKTCTVHWEERDQLTELYPDLNVSEELYEIDGNLMTCSGGLSGLDMILQLITIRHGESLAHQVAEHCIHPNIRPAHDKQRMKLQLRQHGSHPRLTQALELMREHIQPVLSCEQISDRVGLSTRQLERLFRQHLNSSPTNYYMSLRLEFARQQLKATRLPIQTVAKKAGFTSTSYFSRCYKKQFGLTPREARTGVHRMIELGEKA